MRWEANIPERRHIEDYALIGDCEAAGLVANDGSIDWLCLPRFDSPAAFASLLGTRDHGYFRVAPRAPSPKVTRRYLEDTLVLETRFDTSEGAVALIDFMPVRSGGAEVVRIVRGERGAVPMELALVPRFDYGSTIPWLSRVEGGIRAVGGPDALRFSTPVSVELADDAITARFTMRAGDRVAMRLMWAPSHMTMPPASDAYQALEDTVAFWRSWACKCAFAGEHRDAVVRSLITLKALTYAPTGGLVAAATTSLPEHFGGVRNWDYRYCWLRDATFTLLALMDAGYQEEALAFREWLLRATAGRPEQVQIMYGLAGERRLDESELGWLPGFAGATPVRTGNAAYRQHQLDVYGEVMDALHQSWRRASGPRREDWRLERLMTQYVERIWQEPDEGIWEVRGPRRHFTHSKVMAWLAMDRAVRAGERFGLEGPIERWRALRAQIHEQVCREGFDPARGAFVQSYGSKHLDASLLIIPLVGFLPIDDPRVRGTIEAIERELTVDGFVARYKTDPEVDGLPEGEASFLLCSFWLVDCLGLLGRQSEARSIFQKLLAIRNDVGLLSESYDVAARRLAGNFPQAFSHVGLVTAARLFEVARPHAPDERAR